MHEEVKEPSTMFVRRNITSGQIIRQTLVTLVLVYYIWLLLSAWNNVGWWWTPENGVMWAMGFPGQFFPFPLTTGGIAIISHARPQDQLFYTYFMHRGIWILWSSLALLYIISPYRLNTTYLVGKSRSFFARKSRQFRRT